MSPSVEQVTGMLRGVIDPELNVDIVELGMVQRVDVTDAGFVDVVIALTIAGCPLRVQIRDDAVARIRSLPGVTDVHVSFGELNAEQRSQVMQRARWKAREKAPDTEITSTTRIIAVASGKGGVGKSSVACNLAAALAARGFTVGVLDADIWGFSVPRMLGVESRLGGSDGKISPAERIIPGYNGRPDGLLKIVSMGLVVDDEDKAIMWRGLMLAKAVEEFLTKVRWGELDYLLIDMPPGTGDVQMALSRLLPRAELLVVTTPALAAQKVAMRVVDMARRSYLRVGGVVENMSAFIDPSGQSHALFGAGGGQRLADDAEIPLVAKIPIEAAVSTGGDEGDPIFLVAPDGPAGRAFGDLAEQVVTTLFPPIDMAGCSARLLKALENV